MADLARVRSNIGKMIEQGAPESDIDAYIAGEGVTLDQLQAPKREGAADKAAAFLGSAIDSIPIAGPYLKSGALQAGAAYRTARGYEPTHAEALEAIRGLDKKVVEDNPLTSLAGRVAGGVVGTAPLVMAAPAAFGAGAGALAARIAAGTATGGLLGGADAAARHGLDPEKIAQHTLLGAATGGAAPAVGAAIGKVAGNVAGRVKPAPVPTADELKASAKAAYQAADDAGVIVKPEPFGRAYDTMFSRAAAEGVDPTLHPGAVAALKRVAEVIDEPITLQSLETLRKVIGSAGRSQNADEVRIAGIMRKELDGFVNNLRPGDVFAGDPKAGATALMQARSLWNRASKAERIEDAIWRAELRASSTGSGGNVENAIRQNIRQLLVSEGKTFTSAERDAMEQVVRGGPTQNLLRLVGKLSPSGNGLMAALGIGATAANPLMAIPIAGGFFAKKLADQGTQRSADMLQLIVRNGGALPASPAALTADRAAKRLAPAGLLGALRPY